MDKTQTNFQKLKDFLDFLIDEDSDYNLWELEILLKSEHKDDKRLLEQIFTPEQTMFMRALVSYVVYTIDEWHNKDDDESHQDIRTELRELREEFKQHRHDTTQTYSGTPE